MSGFNEMPGYRVGDFDTRPWGRWDVLDCGIGDHGTEFCKKKITVNAGATLSLQSHNLRDGQWTVLEGSIDAVKDDEIITLTQGESIAIPRQTKHRMINKSDADAIIEEIQTGTCREDDIVRYEDVYGRV